MNVVGLLVLYVRVLMHIHECLHFLLRLGCSCYWRILQNSPSCSLNCHWTSDLPDDSWLGADDLISLLGLDDVESNLLLLILGLVGHSHPVRCSPDLPPNLLFISFLMSMSITTQSILFKFNL